MRKLVSGILCTLIIIGFCSCHTRDNTNSEKIKTGVYILQNKNKDDVHTIPNLALEKDNKFTFTYSVLTSNIPKGTYKVKDNKLILSTDTQGSEKANYVFDIKGGTLVYKQAQSTSLPSFSSDEIHDGAVFEYSTSK